MNLFVPLVGLLLFLPPFFLMEGDSRRWPVAVIAYGFLLGAWAMMRRLSRRGLLAVGVGIALGIWVGYFGAPIVNLMADSLAGRQVLVLALYIAAITLAVGLAIERFEGGEHVAAPQGGSPQLKILDTSSIIDGRIVEVAETGFLEGPILVPKFILHELQHIADSADSLKRNRGRRGLDILKGLKELGHLDVRIIEDDFEAIVGVDEKLLLLAREKQAVLITNDFNLNKVARLQGVKVLNINNLANAMKTVLLPGEIMEVTISKEGKEQGQGVAFLEDGTMMVVDEGRRHVGRRVRTVVTNIHQTAAGRIIFSRVEGQD